MKRLTLDLEMNQPSAKIIRAAWIISDPKNKKISLKRDLLVKIDESLSPTIVSLTGITDEALETAPSLQEVYEQLRLDMRNHQVNRIPIQWGTDNLVLQEQLSIPWKDFALAKRSLDVKSLFELFAQVTPGSRGAGGLQKALTCLGTAFVGVPHEPLDDCINTLRVLHLLSDRLKLGECVVDLVGDLKDLES